MLTGKTAYFLLFKYSLCIWSFILHLFSLDWTNPVPSNHSYILCLQVTYYSYCILWILSSWSTYCLSWTQPAAEILQVPHTGNGLPCFSCTPQCLLFCQNGNILSFSLVEIKYPFWRNCLLTNRELAFFHPRLLPKISWFIIILSSDMFFSLQGVVLSGN